MFLDFLARFSDGQDIGSQIVGTVNGTDVIDTIHDYDVGNSNKRLLVVFQVDGEAVTSATSATVQFNLESGSTTALNTILASTAAIAEATLVDGYQITLEIPRGTTERFLGVSYTIGGATLTAGFVSAFIVDAESYQSNTTYVS